MISCPACAHENPDVQKFFGECGARLPGTIGWVLNLKRLAKLLVPEAQPA